MDGNFPRLLCRRQLGWKHLPSQCYANTSHILNLALTLSLDAHVGCVNTLNWNHCQNKLISGSDDRTIILWDVFAHKEFDEKIPFKVIKTGHSENIFDAKEMPFSNDTLFVSCAGDRSIRLHDINHADFESSLENLQTYHCHFERVKALGVTPAQPHVFYSASEDGTLRRIDTREPVDCRQNGNIVPDCPHTIYRTAVTGDRRAELKAMSINPTRPHLVAIGGSDEFARVLDMRMSHPNDIQSYYAPGHLSILYHNQKQHWAHIKNNYRHMPGYNITGLDWSADGSQLLVNLGAEQIYSYDIAHTELLTRPLLAIEALCSFSAQNNNLAEKNITMTMQQFTNKHNFKPYLYRNLNRNQTFMSDEADRLREIANQYYIGVPYTNMMKAIEFYTLALKDLERKNALQSSTAATLLGNRAMAYIKREWSGDCSAAARDSLAALLIAPDNHKHWYRLARALHQCKMPTAARNALIVIDNYFEFGAKEALNRDIATLKHEIYQYIDQIEQEMQKFEDQEKERIAKEKEDSEIQKSKKRRFSESDTPPSTSQQSNSHCIDCHTQLAEIVDRSRQNKSFPYNNERELKLRAQARDYRRRFVGHCNVTTDIKQAKFVGPNAEYVVAGSDDGRAIFWRTSDSKLLCSIATDSSVVNCCLPHPTVPVFFISGIDSTIKKWMPLSREFVTDCERVEDENYYSIAEQNQARMRDDPMASFFRAIRYSSILGSGQLPTLIVTEEVDDAEQIRCAQQ